MLGVIPFSVELLHVLFASFDPQCGKSPDHIQIQEIFVATFYGLSTIQLDLFQMILFYFFVQFTLGVFYCCFLVVCKPMDCSFWKAVQ